MTAAKPDEARTSYARATAAYDPEFELALLCEITTAIVLASRVTDANVVVLRTGEMIAALTTALAGAIALSPYASSPTTRRKLLDEIRKDLQRQVAAAGANPEVQDFIRQSFHGPDTEGCA